MANQMPNLSQLFKPNSVIKYKQDNNPSTGIIPH